MDEPLELDSPYALGIEAGEKAESAESASGAGEWILTTAPLWPALLADLRAGVDKAQIAARFHAAVAAGFVRAAVLARSGCGISIVALSGGCLHNRRLAHLLRAGLEAEGFTVLAHRRASPGDGGLSYGQAAVAAARWRQETDRK